MTSPSTTAPTSDRVLHASLGRTVVLRTDATGQHVVDKVYVAGAMAEAEREFAFGRLAAGPGVVDHLAVGLDAATNRPRVTTRAAAGQDLELLAATLGAVPAATACNWLAPVAHTLARLHARRDAATPAGLCHGDIKPRNLVRTADTTLLLDFEHAAAVGTGPAQPGGFGTPGFQAPEATSGRAARPALDVFALGATLAWLLAGGRTPLPQHADVTALVRACTSPDPAARPDAAALATQLEALATRLREDPAEAALHDWAGGMLRTAPATTGDVRIAPWPRRRRLLQRLPRLLAAPGAVPVEPAPLRVALRTVQRVLQRFPRHATTLQWRRELLAATGHLLGTAPQHIATLLKQEAFAAADAWLAASQALHADAAALPGGVPPITATGAPPLLLRQPDAFLGLLREQVRDATDALAADVGRIQAAETALDLRAAEAAIDTMAARHGGTSPTAARQRDRLHRLGFYLDRIARAEANVERVAGLWDASALQPLTTFVGAAVGAATAIGSAETASGTVGLRSLQLTLANLAEEFTHLPQVPPALDALTDALAHLTDQAWQMLADARARLQSVPVPVRPLQLTLGRLDTFRVLEAFLDRPDRPRSQLLDQIEALRLALEQARATRDRLAASAEHALARGHWTTGLFDMERAVAGLEATDDHERAEATRLQERLEQARRRKQEVEAKVRRNVELATSYGTLQDDPSSTFGARLQVLEERRACLLFLTMHVPAERSVLYHRDLRELDTQLALERAGLAEHQLDGTLDPVQRLQLARATLEQLSQSTSQDGAGSGPPGRLVRLLEHWRTVTAHCQRTVDQLHAEQAQRDHQRRRNRWLLAAALLATTAAVAFAARPWLLPAPAVAGSSQSR